MSVSSLLAFDPNSSLSRLDYSLVDHENDANSNRRDLELEEILVSLSSLYDSLASFWSYELDQLHNADLSLLDRTCSTLRAREGEQALVKSNLRTFLANIHKAFHGFFGAASPQTSLLSVQVNEDLDPTDSQAIGSSLEQDHAADKSKLEEILSEIHVLFQEVVVAQFSTKEELERVQATQIRQSQDAHAFKQDENEQGRQSILEFIKSIEQALQALRRDHQDEATRSSTC